MTFAPFLGNCIQSNTYFLSFSDISFIHLFTLYNVFFNMRIWLSKYELNAWIKGSQLHLISEAYYPSTTYIST